ncbi:unnamed protein product, partial [Ectocarpus sp. 12 AP-2014]
VAVGWGCAVPSGILILRGPQGESPRGGGGRGEVGRHHGRGEAGRGAEFRRRRACRGGASVFQSAAPSSALCGAVVGQGPARVLRGELRRRYSSNGNICESSAAPLPC